MELALQHEVLLGEDWLALHQATLSWEHNCCVVIKGARKFSSVWSTSILTVQQTDGACAEMLTGKQARKAVAQRLLYAVTHRQIFHSVRLPAVLEHLLPANWFTMAFLLHELSGIPPDELPAGVCLDRDVDHPLAGRC